MIAIHSYCKTVNPQIHKFFLTHDCEHRFNAYITNASCNDRSDQSVEYDAPW